MLPFEREDWPRERLRRLGAAALSDAELVALILGTGCRGEDALALARRLLVRFGGLRGLHAAEATELESVGGIGGVRALQFRAVAELAVRLATSPLQQGQVVGNSAEVFAAFGARLAGQKQEQFWVVGVDAKRRVVGQWCIATGHLMGVEVHPREVYRPLIRAAAAAALLVHNHPSGDPAPSVADRVLTCRLGQAGAIVAIALLDHMIVASGGYHSLREQDPALFVYSTSARAADKMAAQYEEAMAVAVRGVFCLGD